MIWNEDKYTIEQDLPSEKQFNTYYIYKEGECVIGCGYDELFTEGNNFLLRRGIIENRCRSVSHLLNNFQHNGYTVETVEGKKKYKELKKAYHAEESRLRSLYFSDLYKHNGVSKKLGDAITQYIEVEFDVDIEHGEIFEGYFDDFLSSFGKFLK